MTQPPMPPNTPPPGYPPGNPPQGPPPQGPPPQGPPQQGPPPQGYPQQGPPPQGPPQQGFPPAQAAMPFPGPPGGQPTMLKFTVQGSVMTKSFIPPTLTIDGYPAPTTLGASMIPINPGMHRLEVSSQWIFKHGHAGLDVNVPPGQITEVFYAPPFHQFTSGRMGLTPQPRPGGLFFAFLMIVIVVTLLIAIALPFTLN